MSDAIQVRPAHFPDRAPIDAYGDGGFRFSNASHKGSILCLPSGIYASNYDTPENLTETVLQPVAEEAQSLELLLIGTGAYMCALPQSARNFLKSHKIKAEVMTTGAAVRTFNILLAEERAVGALLCPVA